MAESLRKILLVEDDEQIAFMTIMALEDLGGFEVRHCPTGQEALDAFEQFAPQIVLMDVMMPEMDGPQTLAQFRKRPGSDAVPVVFMTARAQQHQLQSYLDMGAAGVISKPFDPVALADDVRAFWQSAKTG